MLLILIVGSLYYHLEYYHRFSRIMLYDVSMVIKSKNLHYTNYYLTPPPPRT